MKYLEERNIGFDVGVTKVPLVVQSCIFDLVIGDKDARLMVKWVMRHVRMQHMTILSRAITAPEWEQQLANTWAGNAA